MRHLDQPLSPSPLSTNKSGWRRTVVRLLAVGCWGYLVGLVAVWVLLRWADLWWPATVVMFSPRLLFALPAVLLLPLAALARRPALAAVVAVAAALALGPVSGGRVPWRAAFAGPADGFPLRVLTCNMHYGRVDSARLDRLIEETQPQIVALQEWRLSNTSDVLTGPDWHTHRHSHLFLASRYPIRRTEDIGGHSYRSQGLVTRYEVETPAGLVTVYSLHLASPRDAIRDTVRDPDAGGEDMADNTTLRRQQSRYIAGQAARTRGAHLLLGDFNTPPESALFRQEWAGYTDAFAAAGLGWGYTFYGGKTAVRIDHVLASRGWECNACWVGPNVGSPHRPVLADLTWPLQGTSD
ncbi:MAG: endonuclease/exonuclease/phosphatase family protein [Gemmataceae bacterium]